MSYFSYSGDLDMGRSLFRDTVILNLSLLSDETSSILLVSNSSFKPWCP